VENVPEFSCNVPFIFNLLWFLITPGDNGLYRLNVHYARKISCKSGLFFTFGTKEENI
jgi:hypothetical protein